jgi:hypothetical protein
MSDHRIMIGRALCRNFAHHWFQVSEGDRKGEQGELARGARGIKQGECIMYIVICVRVYK